MAHTTVTPQSAAIRRLLYQHPKVQSESARVRFVRFGSSSLDLEVFAYILAPDYVAFLAVQEDLLLHIMDIIEASGTGVAFPSQVTYLVIVGIVDAGNHGVASEIDSVGLFAGKSDDLL